MMVLYPPGVLEAIRMTELAEQVQRSTFRRWEHASVRLTAVPEGLEQSASAPNQPPLRQTGFTLGIDRNPMSREEVEQLRDLCSIVLEECPPERIAAALDPAKGLAIAPVPTLQ